VTDDRRGAHETNELSEPPLASSITFVVRGPIKRVDLQGLGKRFRDSLCASETPEIECDIDSLVGPDVEAVDALARLQLLGQQAGRHIRVRGASAELRELLEFFGLNDVVELCT
jgi:ABC-type transporter Mla MlaB component